MITRKFLRTTRFSRPVLPRFYSPSALSSGPSKARSPAPISRFSRLTKPAFIPSHFGNTITTFSTMVPSKRDPTMHASLNEADRLEKLLDKDGFKKWGFVIYRCTYQNNIDWENFMARFVSAVPDYLEFYNGLDLLDTFTPTVLEDPSFEGATVATLREHFNQWAKSSLKEEQGVAEDYQACTGRYRFFIMVDQEAMDSVLSAPEDEDEAAFVRMVYAEWEPEVPDEEDIAKEPIEGCTQNDVGWMKTCWRWVQLPGFHKMQDWDDWEAYYVRPPEIGDIP
ncbi:unnamed protein product [Penicillium salamii]|uniref:Uncharacterized protein n=1 Tax=Penicillium salamii TaxID=1612424 RepID=A0A9W4NU50_9EURO|nr:unnamed protein product [Penicillium salamii]CAG8360711.1 unnamed protein product [Penicillium salamii]CAG8421027.1 unnamed protein product [Penicillium salamii]CAG8424383.1 unnamed protein product [Penicillium salamii]